MDRVIPGSSPSTQLNPATPHYWEHWAEGVSAGLESRPRHPLPTIAVEGAARHSCCEPCPCVCLFTLRSHAQGETYSPNTHFGSPVATCMSVRVVQNKFYLSLLYLELRTALCKPCLDKRGPKVERINLSLLVLLRPWVPPRRAGHRVCEHQLRPLLHGSTLPPHTCHMSFPMKEVRF